VTGGFGERLGGKEGRRELEGEGDGIGEEGGNNWDGWGEVWPTKVGYGGMVGERPNPTVGWEGFPGGLEGG